MVDHVLRKHVPVLDRIVWTSQMTTQIKTFGLSIQNLELKM